MADELQPDSNVGCLLQLFWGLVGPGLVLVTGAILILNRPPLGAWPDFVLAGLAALVGLARVLDRKPSPDGVPRSRFRYLAVLAAVVVGFLLVAHVLAPRFA